MVGGFQTVHGGWGGRACRRENQKNQYLGRARADDDDGDATISVLLGGRRRCESVRLAIGGIWNI